MSDQTKKLESKLIENSKKQNLHQENTENRIVQLFDRADKM